MNENKLDGHCTDDSERLWPDELELDDRVKFDGNEYVVVGTGPAEATLERADGMDVTAKAFRWAFSNAVEIELSTTVKQDAFERYVEPDTDRREE